MMTTLLILLMNPLPEEETVSASEDCVRNPHKLTAYHTTIHKQLKRGFIEEASNPRITTGHA